MTFTPLPACPLCQRQEKPGRAKLLYGHPVCRKCYYAFANRRQLAFILDHVGWQILIAILFFGIGVAIALSGGAVTDEIGALMNILSWLLFLPFLFKDGFKGASPGKWLCGVQVLDTQTREPAGFGASFKRNLPLFIPFVPLIVAFQLLKGNRLGDKWANTFVVWKKYANTRVFGASGKCEKCQYDLSGNTSGICPECGTPLSPENQAYLHRQNPPLATW
jgi:uncharacterized RDD family membrane protein YckC